MKDKIPELMYRIGMLQSEMENLSSDHNFLNIKDEKARLKYLQDIISNCESRSKQYGEKLNLKENNIMKKSELKALLKIITEEVVAAKRAQFNETKGLSGMKKSAESTEHTEKVAASKDLTGPAPKEKQEGKKLPVVKKPANPKTVGSLKEEILNMIREEIDEMARVKGAVGNKFKVEDPSSPTGWVVKGHKTIPDGTPTEAPKGPYVPKGAGPDSGDSKMKSMSTPPLRSMSDKAAVARTEEAVTDILKFKPNATPEEIADELAKLNSDDMPLKLDAVTIANAMEKAKEISADGDEPEGEPDISDLEAKEKAEKKKKMDKLRTYLLRKRGLK